jgi:hypothetical protein
MLVQNRCPGSPGCRAATPRADDGRRPGAVPDRRAWKQVLFKRYAISAHCRIAMQSGTHRRVPADMPTLCLDAPASAKSLLARAPHKRIPPRDAGALGGKLQQRSGIQTQFWSVVFIGDSLLQVNRNCRRQAATEARSPDRGVVVCCLDFRGDSDASRAPIRVLPARWNTPIFLLRQRQSHHPDRSRRRPD